MAELVEIGTDEIYGYTFEIKADLPDGVEVFVSVRPLMIETEPKILDKAKEFAESLCALVGELEVKKANDAEMLI